MRWSGPKAWVGNAAIVLIILAFVFFFGQPQSQGSGGAVAEVAGQTIGEDAFFHRRRNIESSLANQLPPDMDRGQLENLLDTQAVNQLIQSYVMAHDARKLGLEDTSRSFSRFLARVFSGPDGRFSKTAYESNIRGMGYTSERSFASDWQTYHLDRRFRRLIIDAVRVSDPQAREALERDRLRVSVRYATGSPVAFAARLEISDEEALAFAESDPARVEGAYQARIDEFRQPEEIRARHILFEGEDGLERAEAIQARLSAGESFTALAGEASDDGATADSGGDLGFFPRGRMLQAFEDVAFAMEPGTVSAPVTTERGVHLILLEERRAAVDRTLDEVRLELARDVMGQERAREEARQAVQKVIDAANGGTDFKTAATRHGLEVSETTPFGHADFAIPGIGRVPGLKETALKLSPEAPVAGQVFSDGQNFYAITLLERSEPEGSDVEAELANVRDRMQEEARFSLLNDWTRNRVELLERGGEIVRYPLFPSS